MKEEILDIAKKLYHNHLTIETGTNLLLSLLCVSNHVICDDWIHEERVKQNDDNYCPICGKQLQSK
jgi:hypothetical protein